MLPSNKDKQRMTEAVTAHSPHATQAMSNTRYQQLTISSEQLFAGATELHIEHRGALYRLKHTSLGKLILTK